MILLILMVMNSDDSTLIEELTFVADLVNGTGLIW